MLENCPEWEQLFRDENLFKDLLGTRHSKITFYNQNNI